MKKIRILSLLLAAALCLPLAACGKKGESGPAASDAPDPAALADTWAQAITGARDDELNSAFPVMTPASESDPANTEMTFALLGFAPEDVESYAISLSLMNVSAYAIVAVMPAEGKAETVKEGLENYVEAQKGSFEFYLEDQFQIASDAKLETLDDGTLLLVMCEGQDTVLDNIKSALAG